MKSLDPSKAHGHYEISIQMINHMILQSQNLCQFSLETVLNFSCPRFYVIIGFTSQRRSKSFSMNLPVENEIKSRCLKTDPRGFFSGKATATNYETVYFNNDAVSIENL